MFGPLTDTTTPGRTEPVESLTAPERPPVVRCASRGDPRQESKATKTKILRMAPTPFDAVERDTAERPGRSKHHEALGILRMVNRSSARCPAATSTRLSRFRRGAPIGVQARAVGSLENGVG